MTAPAATKERGIIFSAPMVRAILDGRKTMTRRIVKPQPPDGYSWNPDARCFGISTSGLGLVRFCPFGVPGERLWVRETFVLCSSPLSGRYPVFRADLALLDDDPDGGQRWARPDGRTVDVMRWEWKSPIHLPRALARIRLEVMSVRVERLNQISEADAIAEGMQCDGIGPPGDRRGVLSVFADGWDTLHKPGARWADNPWVWVVEFRRVS